MTKNFFTRSPHGNLNEKGALNSPIAIRIEASSDFKVVESEKQKVVIHHNRQDISKLKRWSDTSTECILKITQIPSEEMEWIVRISGVGNTQFNPQNPDTDNTTFNTELEILEIIK